jgi:myotubularin-related protein 1/2
VHCSDGWDRTSQLSALAQVLIDPFYRTIDGFAILIEKEFCSFGHMFFSRSEAGSQEYSPVFLQFLDTVWQLQNQFPMAFEFNENLLLSLIDGFYSGWSTTFLGDCERERGRLSKRHVNGPSVWQLIEMGVCRNGSYRASKVPIELLHPNISIKSIQLWRGLFFRRNFL